MNCEEVRRSVQDYVTRELNPEGRRLFDAHLVECAECQRELALMTALVSTLDHQPVLEPSAGWWSRPSQTPSVRARCRSASSARCSWPR